MTTTENIGRIHPEAIDRLDHATPEDLAQQVFYEIEIVGQDPGGDWERFNLKLDELRASFPQEAATQTPQFS